ncbi:hypothetical protein PY650_05895 [Rhizobium calliandrae]|uniref:Uncharacterized protein n=1 Tax=Rhizobium calliandrae TaxID=1312182 RepID=A0ABT7K9A5_9HYPH|nr:hypothetical protein [Rhizobium calliandrae]MDL2405193.1 hypothetical protein [Rhizobium calliandrae]
MDNTALAELEQAPADVQSAGGIEILSLTAIMKRIIRATMAIMTALTCGVARADSNDCRPITEAIGKLNSAAQFQQKGIITAIDTGKSYSHDYLVSGDKEYEREDNRPWTVGVRQPIQLVIDGKSTVSECSRDGVERLGDVSAIVYTYKRLTPGHLVRDVRLWVTESTGKPLQTEISIEADTSRKGKFTFSYDPNAALPMGGDQ